MLSSVLFHPFSTFVAGLLVALFAVFFLLSSCAAPNTSAEKVAHYRSSMNKVAASGFEAGGPAEKAALQRFSSFLEGIGDVKYVRENTAQGLLPSDAYLDDTLVVHQGAAEIEAYFIKTSETMTSYQVTVDDVAQLRRRLLRALDDEIRRSRAERWQAGDVGGRQPDPFRP